VNRRGKIVALATVGVGVVVLVAAGFAAKGRIREEWYIHQLQSANEETRLHAAERLGELKSLRAVPELIRMLRANGDEGWFRRGESDIVHFTPLAHALYRVGDGALPMLVDWARSGGGGAHDLATIALAIRSPEVPVTTASYDDLRRVKRLIRPVSELSFPSTRAAER